MLTDYSSEVRKTIDTVNRIRYQLEELNKDCQKRLDGLNETLRKEKEKQEEAKQEAEYERG